MNAMYPEPQKDTVDRKIIALLAVLLVLVSIGICYGAYSLLRGRQAARVTPQVVQTEIPVATPAASLPQVITFDVFLPVVLDPSAPQALSAPAATVSTTWRFLSIDEDDIGTFENVANPNQTLLAVCRDPERKPPQRGALYTLYETGILRAQIEPWTVQRFRVFPDE